MPTGLRRIYGRGHLHFLTFSCYGRLPLLKSQHSRKLFLEEIARVRVEYGFRLIGYVVMPEHVHLLVSEPKKGAVSTVMQMLKQRVSRKMRKVEENKLAPAFWIERFYDFNVYSEKKIREKLDYMHANPVTRGLVEHPGDWMWSSWSSVVKGEKGLIRTDPWD